MLKGTFGHVQKVKTQTSRCVSDATSDQGLHLLILVTSIAHIYLAVLNNWITYYSFFQYSVGAHLGLHYV